jgi:drug/metabolite transporter (DMT)-like permease
VLTGSLVSVLVFLPVATMNFAVPEAKDMLIFLGMGLFGSAGGLAIAYAFQNAPSAAVIAPTHYTQIVWGTLIGYIFFSEVPHLQTIIGAGVIAVAGLYLIYGEARYKKRIEAIARAELEVTNKP